ncbi:MAG: pirin family protein, partial [Rhodospirillaceae bacterium]
QRDLGGFHVGRVLPFAKRHTVGPFIFFDHMGPAIFPPGRGMDVRPHPHIGLATVTYLFEGEILHRDSLGTVQMISPGDVNWMVAGRGIVHSERTPDPLRASGFAIHGIQSWVALPRVHEHTAPSFAHHPAATLPLVDRPGARLRIIAGHGFGARSPAKVFSDTLYVDAQMEKGAVLDLPPEHAERAVYVVEGSITINGEPVATATMAVLKPEIVAHLVAASTARLMLLGGAALDGSRLIWWNMVASDQALIDQAKADWKSGPENKWQRRFTLPPDESEFTPLPES